MMPAGKLLWWRDEDVDYSGVIEFHRKCCYTASLTMRRSIAHTSRSVARMTLSERVAFLHVCTARED